MKGTGFVYALLFCLPLTTVAVPRDTLVRNVKIGFGYSTSIFPVEWQRTPISAAGEPIESNQVNRSQAVTINALKKYPEELLRLNLRFVYWLKKMSFYDVGYGGTNSNNALYLTNDGEAMGYTNTYLEQTFHHEFSSILFRNYPSLFDTMAWKTATENIDYNDPEDGVGAIRNNASSQDLDTFLCRRGVLTQYALSSLENDLNTFAQNIFSPSPGFWDIVDRFPRIREKTRLLIAFYKKINPVFSEKYFKSLKNE